MIPSISPYIIHNEILEVCINKHVYFSMIISIRINIPISAIESTIIWGMRSKFVILVGGGCCFSSSLDGLTCLIIDLIQEPEKFMYCLVVCSWWDFNSCSRDMSLSLSSIFLTYITYDIQMLFTVQFEQPLIQVFFEGH